MPRTPYTFSMLAAGVDAITAPDYRDPANRTAFLAVVERLGTILEGSEFEIVRREGANG